MNGYAPKLDKVSKIFVMQRKPKAQKYCDPYQRAMTLESGISAQQALNVTPTGAKKRDAKVGAYDATTLFNLLSFEKHYFVESSRSEVMRVLQHSDIALGPSLEHEIV